MKMIGDENDRNLYEDALTKAEHGRCVEISHNLQ